MDFILIIIGFVLLIKCADLFVKGSSNIAKALKIPTFLNYTLLLFYRNYLEKCLVFELNLSNYGYFRLKIGV